MNIHEFISATNGPGIFGFLRRPLLICNDGFSVSIQGSEGHYCLPRKITKDYTSMELGFPSAKEPLIMKFAEIKDEPTSTVYGWVPVEIIQEVIEKHGGINILETFK